MKLFQDPIRARILFLSYMLTLISCGNSSQFTSPTKVKGDEADATPGASGALRQVVDEFQHVNRGAEIFLGIDTSSSMDDEKAFLENNMNAFINGLVQAQLDVRVTAIGSDDFKFPADIPKDRFAVVNKKIGSRDAIKVLTDFFRAGNYPLPMNPGTNVEVVIVSDDDGLPFDGYSAADFVGPKDHNVLVNAIVGLKGGENTPNCYIEHVGQEHINLAKKTGGGVFDLCEENWDNLIKKLSDTIVQRNLTFKLQSPPEGSREIQVTLNDQVLDPDLYIVDATLQTVTFKPEVGVTADSKVKISYYTKSS